MAKKISKGLVAYIITDYLAAAIAWTIFFIFRKLFLEPYPVYSLLKILNNVSYYYGIIIIPAFWLLLFVLFDSYSNIYRMSRLTELMRSVYTVLLGTTMKKDIKPIIILLFHSTSYNLV